MSDTLRRLRELHDRQVNHEWTDDVGMYLLDDDTAVIAAALGVVRHALPALLDIAEQIELLSPPFLIHNDDGSWSCWHCWQGVDTSADIQNIPHLSGCDGIQLREALARLHRYLEEAT